MIYYPSLGSHIPYCRPYNSSSRYNLGTTMPVTIVPEELRTDIPKIVKKTTTKHQTYLLYFPNNPSALHKSFPPTIYTCQIPFSTSLAIINILPRSVTVGRHLVYRAVTSGVIYVHDWTEEGGRLSKKSFSGGSLEWAEFVKASVCFGTSYSNVAPIVYTEDSVIGPLAKNNSAIHTCAWPEASGYEQIVAKTNDACD
jgi:hypothetical protein